MGYVRLTTTQIVDIYKHVVLKVDGKWTVGEAATNTGSTPGGVSNSIKRMKAYLKYQVSSHKSRAYVAAAKEIRQIERDMNTPKPVIKDMAFYNGENEEIDMDKLKKEPGSIIRVAGDPSRVMVTLDRYQKLQAAVEAFQDQVQNFIEEEVKAQTAPILEENRLLKEKLGEARTGNWVQGLQTKFNPERKTA